jgi:hypothetical protein
MRLLFAGVVLGLGAQRAELSKAPSEAFGIDWTKEYDTPIGRPIKIANGLDDSTGAPIQGLL